MIESSQKIDQEEENVTVQASLCSGFMNLYFRNNNQVLRKMQWQYSSSNA